MLRGNEDWRHCVAIYIKKKKIIVSCTIMCEKITFNTGLLIYDTARNDTVWQLLTSMVLLFPVNITYSLTSH